MIFPSNRVRIMLATKPVDFRKGHDGLTALVKTNCTRTVYRNSLRVSGPARRIG
ncbi:IS66 Orf2 family protein [Agrobacterium tumefaciens]|nr:IS66 Orf2 family protein [Agrobacterium tumefaciens]